MSLLKYNYEQTRAIFNKYFSLGYLNTSLEKKLLLICMVCYITNSINKNKPIGKQVNAYQVLCKIGKDMPDEVHLDFFKALGALCDDLLYGCKEVPTFGIEPKIMPQEL